MSRQFAAGAALAVLALAAGCGGGRKIVPVSGVVTVDGEPAKNVVVSFQPLQEKAGDNPGRGSSAYTDENGRYTLIYDGEKPGALTGKHRVRISPQWVTKKTGADAGEGGSGPAALNYLIPPEWNDLSTKEFDVPSGGTDTADFHIETKAPPKKK
jgi:hypothetical protein